MRRFNLGFLGFGHVGQALVRLLSEKSADLRESHGIEWRITGIATRGYGWIADSQGVDRADVLKDRARHASPSSVTEIGEWLRHSCVDVVFETTSLNPWTGQPAIDHIKSILEFGAHAITANKGPVVHAYDELSELAKSRGNRFMFESSVMDCVPVFSLFRECLPAARVLAFRGILNSTSGVVIERMEQGATLEEGIRAAQSLGIAEADPSYDIDGWDAAVKTCAIANVVMNLRLKLKDVQIQGIRELKSDELRIARAKGSRFKLVSRIQRVDDRRVGSAGILARVQPELVSPPDPLSNAEGTSLVSHYELDVLPGLTLSSYQPDLKSTAYGMLADFINAVRG